MVAFTLQLVGELGSKHSKRELKMEEERNNCQSLAKVDSVKVADDR